MSGHAATDSGGGEGRRQQQALVAVRQDGGGVDHEDGEPTLDEAFDANEILVNKLFLSGEDLQDVRAQLAEAERVLAFIKTAPTIEIARMWARSYFGEESPF